MKVFFEEHRKQISGRFVMMFIYKVDEKRKGKKQLLCYDSGSLVSGLTMVSTVCNVCLYVSIYGIPI